MSCNVTEHYAKHLAPVYSWMIGDFEVACAANQEFFDRIGLRPRDSDVAVDLGCGHGIQAIPLARRGFNVVAIDSCGQLLAELLGHADTDRVKTVHTDLVNFTDHLPQPAAAIVCMGDTLTHLPTLAAVQSLVRDMSRSLCAGGTVCLSFRDYSSRELAGPDRFIPVRSDANRIHTCFLEYQSTVVVVYDIIHERVDQAWKPAISSYCKLRLSPDDVISFANSEGLTLVERSESKGMLYLTLTR